MHRTTASHYRVRFPGLGRMFIIAFYRAPLRWCRYSRVLVWFGVVLAFEFGLSGQLPYSVHGAFMTRFAIMRWQIFFVHMWRAQEPCWFLKSCGQTWRLINAGWPVGPTSLLFDPEPYVSLLFKKKALLALLFGVSCCRIKERTLKTCLFTLII